jgi:hypothetical protein
MTDDPKTEPAPIVVADVARMSDDEIELFTDQFIAGMIRRADEAEARGRRR